MFVMPGSGIAVRACLIAIRFGALACRAFSSLTVRPMGPKYSLRSLRVSPASIGACRYPSPSGSVPSNMPRTTLRAASDSGVAYPVGGGTSRVEIAPPSGIGVDGMWPENISPGCSGWTGSAAGMGASPSSVARPNSSAISWGVKPASIRSEDKYSSISSSRNPTALSSSAVSLGIPHSYWP